MNNSTKLYRSRTHRVFGGVAGGLADYFNVDVILMRLLFVIVFFAGGGGVIIYIVLWIITPEAPLIKYPNTDNQKSSETYTDSNISDADIVDDGNKKDNNNRTFIVGIALILVGFLFLLNSMMPQLIIINLWPLILVIVGVMLIVNETKFTKTNNNESSKTESHEI